MVIIMRGTSICPKNQEKGYRSGVSKSRKVEYNIRASSKKITLKVSQ
jgi:hypothetical protein